MNFEGLTPKKYKRRTGPALIIFSSCKKISNSYN
jgi:hypothetical protein